MAVIGVTAPVAGVAHGGRVLLTGGCLLMQRLNGGSDTGDEERIAGARAHGELLSDGRVWNDNAYTWESYPETRLAKTYGLVQQRAGYAEFGRQYERYQRSNADSDDARRLSERVHDPEADWSGDSGESSGSEYR